MHFNVKEDIIALTPQWKGDRLPDGRPYVPDKYLKALQGMTLEEVWKPIFVLGYESQFEGRLRTLHNDGRKLIGRAVTCTFCPTRPDLHEVMFGIGAEEGRKGNYNQWVIDSLIEGDVVVADMYDKIYKGTFIGGNLTTAIKTKTKTGGAVVWGGIRDVEQMEKVEGVQVTTAESTRRRYVILS
jgi:regulator of RNase E activity RraA